MGGDLMARPKNCRRVNSMPLSNYFKPRGIPLRMLEESILTVDEFEALRLADLDGLYQDQAAVKMGVSRQTFGRIIESAHKKVAEALVKGKALKIEGGQFEMALRENSHAATVSRHLSFLLERAGLRIVLPAKAPTFKGQRMIKDVGEGRVNVAVGQTKKQIKGEFYESWFCSSN